MAARAALFRNLSSYLLDHPQLFDQAVLNCFLKKDRTDAYAAYTNCASEKEAGRFFVDRADARVAAPFGVELEALDPDVFVAHARPHVQRHTRAKAGVQRDPELHHLAVRRDWLEDHNRAAEGCEGCRM